MMPITHLLLIIMVSTKVITTVTLIMIMTVIISNGNRAEWSIIQEVIGRVISNLIGNYKHDYP